MSEVQTPEDIPTRFAESWNTRDAAGLAGLFAEDADFVNVVGLWWNNRADIQRAHAYGLSTFFKNSTLSIRKVRVRKVGSRTAIVHARWRLSGQLDKQGGVLDDRQTIMIFVAEKRDDRWVVLAAHNTDVVPGKETYSSKGGSLESVDYRA